MNYIVVFLLICSQVFAQLKTEKTIVALEKSRFEALVKKDYGALDALFSDQLVYVHADGKIDTKPTFVAGLKNGTRTYKSITLDTLKVRVFRKAAVLNGDVVFCRINKKGEQVQQKLRYTALYVKEFRDWQMVSWHSTDMTYKK